MMGPTLGFSGGMQPLQGAQAQAQAGQVVRVEWYSAAEREAKGKQALPTRLAATAGDIIYFEWDVPFAPHAGSTNVFLLPSPEAFRASDFSNAMFLSDKSPFVYSIPHGASGELYFASSAGDQRIAIVVTVDASSLLEPLVGTAAATARAVAPISEPIGRALPPVQPPVPPTMRRPEQPGWGTRVPGTDVPPHMGGVPPKRPEPPKTGRALVQQKLDELYATGVTDIDDRCHRFISEMKPEAAVGALSETISLGAREPIRNPSAFVMNLLLKWARGEAGRGEKPVRSTEKTQKPLPPNVLEKLEELFELGVARAAIDERCRSMLHDMRPDMAAGGVDEVIKAYKRPGFSIRNMPSFIMNVLLKWHKGNTGSIVTCRNCGEPGHLARECPSITCHHCGGARHLAKECPMKQPSSSAGVVGGAKCLPCAPAAKGSMDGRLSAAAALGGNVVHGVAALSSELDDYVDENCRSYLKMMNPLAAYNALDEFKTSLQETGPADAAALFALCKKWNGNCARCGRSGHSHKSCSLNPNAAAGTSVEKDKAGGANPGVGKPAAGVGVRDSDRAIVDDLLEEMYEWGIQRADIDSKCHEALNRLQPETAYNVLNEFWDAVAEKETEIGNKSAYLMGVIKCRKPKRGRGKK